MRTVEEVRTELEDFMIEATRANHQNQKSNIRYHKLLLAEFQNVVTEYVHDDIRERLDGVI